MGSTSTTTQAYGEVWYWDNRYANESGPFDWYQKYPALAPLINLYAPHRHNPVLIVGCGNSAFSEGMVDDGYEDVYNVDISPVVINAMKQKYSSRPQLNYMKMDVRDMSAFQTSSFDAVIDKGTLDSILQFEAKFFSYAWRSLEVTYGAPVYRLNLLKEPCKWAIKLHVIDKFLYNQNSEQAKYKLTDSVPLNEDKSSVEAALGKNPDVHYIYVCIKDSSSKATGP